MSKRFELLALLFIIFVVESSFGARPLQVEANPPIPKFPPRYSGMFSSLGLVCKCCDGARDGCRSSWEGSCSGKLHCAPWKHA